MSIYPPLPRHFAGREGEKSPSFSFNLLDNGQKLLCHGLLLTSPCRRMR
ncbi:MAG: hypothetical protein J6Y35_01990 [Bacteroidales bacterium]|nr:hypothetical protein [Bacteroidales bacterium]